MHGFLPAARKIRQDITEPYGGGVARISEAMLFINERCRQCIGKIAFP